MGKIYDKNQESAHGPFGESQNHQGPYGGRTSDTLTNKKAANVIPPVKDSKARTKH